MSSNLSAANLLDFDDEELTSISSWLSFPVDRRDLLDILANYSLYPDTFPLERRSREIVMAQIRNEMSKKEASQMDKALTTMVVTNELIKRIPYPALAVLTVINAFQPEGVIPLVYLNKEGKDPEAEKIFFGTLIAFSQVGQSGLAARISVETESEETAQIDLPSGELVLLPIGEEPVTLEVDCRQAQLDGRKQAVVDAVGGEVGIILDARGRPIKLPEQNNDRQETIGRWLDVFS